MELQINKTDKSLTLVFSDDVGKFGTSEILDEYYLTNEKLLNILQKYDEMLEMLKKVYDSINMQSEIEYCSDTYFELEQLIKEATEL